jgi:phenylacetic acid degradation operon negative regulatory protein
VTQKLAIGNYLCVTIGCMKPAAKPDALARATKGLLRRFRSQRPLRGGSLLITLFGDSIAPRGGVVTLGSLIQLAAPFGLTERLVRTSVARLAQDGWLIARRDGRRSEYRLTPRGAARFAQATQRIYSQGPVSWNGEWTLILLPPQGGKQRESVRDGLRWLGCGQLWPGVFAHPSSNIGQAREWLRSLDGAAKAVVLKSSSDDLAVDRQVVGEGWDLGDLARRYRRFVDAFSAVVAAAETESPPPDPQAAFVVRTLLIHDYRKIHLQDPLLPPALLPDDWVGSRAYELCRNLYARVFTAAEDYLTATANTLSESLPAADLSAHGRFGGVLTKLPLVDDSLRFTDGALDRAGTAHTDARADTDSLLDL